MTNSDGGAAAAAGPAAAAAAAANERVLLLTDETEERPASSKTDDRERDDTSVGAQSCPAAIVGETNVPKEAGNGDVKEPLITDTNVPTDRTLSTRTNVPTEPEEKESGTATAGPVSLDDAGGGPDVDDGGTPAATGQEHVSCKYTREDLIARRLGMTMEQMKRVKALIRLGVEEEDLVIANRLLKLGNEATNDAPLTKEEQLLGYSLQQRQRMKALHTLGLTEEAFERCRAIMLSSLGPSAFGFDVDETAASAARAAVDHQWTPADKTRKRPHHSVPGVHGLLKMKSLNSGQFHKMKQLMHSGINNNAPPNGVVRSPKNIVNDAGSSAQSNNRGDQWLLPRKPARRASDSDRGLLHLPQIIRAERPQALALGDSTAAGGKDSKVQPVQGAPRAGLPLGPMVASPLSTRTDPG